MISSTAEYALRAMVELAMQPSAARTARQVAAAAHVPTGYVSKVLQDLGRAGLVNSQRGPNGGFTLTRQPSAITVLDVVNAVDPIRRIRVCPLGRPEHGSKLCRLHQRLDDAIAGVELAFASTTIAELLEPSGGSPRCGVKGDPPRLQQATIRASLPTKVPPKRSPGRS